jgi:23S rRNA pseudouridine1911/1915/1917 synthase
VAKTTYIELNDGTRIPILYEDRSVIAIDKPFGWMLVPFSWQNTNRNLHAAIVSSISSGAFWARSRGLKFLCHVHRLDAETTGVLLFGRSRGAVESLGVLFENRKVRKRYLAVVTGEAPSSDWTCHLKLGPDPTQTGRVRVDAKEGKEAETHFAVLESNAGLTLIEARPMSGRTHQIRVHLKAAGLPIVGDALYGGVAPPIRVASRERIATALALRAIDLDYTDPFSKRRVEVRAPFEEFVRKYKFHPDRIPD